MPPDAYIIFGTKLQMSIFRRAGKPSYSYRRSDGQHRRQRIVTRRLLNFMSGYLGAQLYFIGAYMLRSRRNFFRRIRHFLRRCFGWLSRNCKAVLRIVGSGLSSMAADLTNPFRKLWRSAKSLSGLMQEMEGVPARVKAQRVRTFWHYGWLWNRHLAERFLSYVLPVLCGVLCIFTVRTITGLNYAIAVSYNGQEIGYVADESVYDSAVKIIDSRIITVDENSWQPSATLTIAVASAEPLSLYSHITSAKLVMALPSAEKDCVSHSMIKFLSSFNVFIIPCSFFDFV